MSFFIQRSSKRRLLLHLAALVFSVLLFVFNPLTVHSEEKYVDLIHHHTGNPHEGGGCYSLPIYHVHSGNPEAGGACYTPVFHTHSGSCYRTEECIKKHASVLNKRLGSSYCSIHGSCITETIDVSYRHSSCGSPNNTETVYIGCTSCGGTDIYSLKYHSYTVTTCGLSPSSVTGYSLVCGKEEGVTIEGYAPGCGLEDGRTYGRFGFKNDLTGWTKENVLLNAYLHDTDEVLASEGYGLISFSKGDGEILSDSGNQIYASENGTYTARLSVNDALFNSSEAILSITVSNIDRTPPRINKIEQDVHTPWLSDSTVRVFGIDLQPDDTPGSGLAEIPFSFDGGLSWQEDNSYAFTANGNYIIKLRDKCGNISEAEITISNIDDIPPSLSYDKSPALWHSGDTSARKFTFTAMDNESGLHEFPFSYDEGETWVSDAYIMRQLPGSFSVWVRDSLNNISVLEIDNEYDPQPASSKDNAGSEGNSDTKSNNDSQTASEGSSTGESTSAKDYADKSSNKKTDVIKSSGSDNLPGNSDNQSISGENTNPNRAVLPVADIIAPLPALNPSLFKHTSPQEEETQVIYEENYSEGDISADSGSVRKPFYKTKAFKTAVSSAGALLGLGLLMFMALLMCSGVLLYSFDGESYNLIGLLIVYKSARGRSVNITKAHLERSFSRRFRLTMGPVFVRRFKNELLYIHIKDNWISVGVDRRAIFDLTEA